MFVESHRGHLRVSEADEVDEVGGVVTVDEEGDGDGERAGEIEGEEVLVELLPRTPLMECFNLSP